MPEGPSLVILREDADKFVGHVVRAVSGNSRLPIERLDGQRLLELHSWGKHLLLQVPGFYLRVHFMLWGSWRVDERREATPRLALGFDNGELNFYACSLMFGEGDMDEHYDWRGDVMSDAWDPAAARRKLKTGPGVLAADALLDQGVFAGVGNIIKNEVLFRIRVDPHTPVGALSARKLGELVAQAREYSFDFYRWKKDYVLKKHYQVHTRTECPRCGRRLEFRAKLGRAQRRAFFCGHCQKLYE